MVVWGLIIGASVALLAISAGSARSEIQMAYVNLAIAAAVCITFALLGISEIRKRVLSGASRKEVAASTARFMGLVWTWGALSLVVMYATGILDWKEWWQFFFAFFAAAALSLGFSALLKRDTGAGTKDETILAAGRVLAYVQFFGMLAVMIGLVLDGKIPANFQAKPGWEDWGANHVFFFGAMALAALSAYGIRVQRPAADIGQRA